jgi:hypothetical protein
MIKENGVRVKKSVRTSPDKGGQGGGMFRIEVKGLKDVVANFGYLGKELPTAVRNSLNDLAFMIRTNQMETVKRVFDRPKPQTVKNFFVRKATRENLSATIWFDQIFNKSYDQYIIPEVEGGRRKMKPSEQRLGRFYVPGMGAKMDAYGNMKGGQITQILSHMGRFGNVAGYSMNRTAKSATRKRGGAKALEYFMITEQRGGLKPGIYMRTEKRGGFTSTGLPRTSKKMGVGAWQAGKTVSSVRGRGAIPVILFSKKGAPSYRPRFPFYEVANKVIEENCQRLMDKEVAFAIRRMRR